MARRALVLLVIVAAGAAPARGGGAASSPGGDGAIEIFAFRDAPLRFSPDSSAIGLAPGSAAEDRGRIVRTEVALPDSSPGCRIFARISLSPVPKDERSVCDRWDRAGNVRLVFDDGPDLEIARFMTSYGGRSEHEVDVSDLAPLLRGRKSVRAYVDTWVNPAWRLDVSLGYTPDTTYDAPVWAEPVFYTDSFTRKENGEGVTVPVEVPAGLARVVLRYFSTGHCTDGRDEDEFVSKANVVSVDGAVVVRFHPWRDDCRQFRDRNPYCARWSDGSWSSDYSRSGWCPGDLVQPMEFDLTDHLGAGPHTMRFVIEGIRPEDAEGDFGYWRVSAALIGWDHPPRLWRN